MMLAVVPDGANVLNTLREPTQPEQQQHRSDRLYDQLRQREVRRGEPDEADAGHQTGAAEQDERRKTMELGLVGSRQSAGDSDSPDHSEHEIECCWRRAFGSNSARVERRDPGKQRGADQQLQLRLQAPRTEDALQPSCKPPREGDQHAIENALTLDVAQQRRAFADEQI